MAVKKTVTIERTCDLTGAKKGVEPVRFALGDKVFEIDLTVGNRRALEKSLGKYMQKGRVIAVSSETVTPNATSKNTHSPLVRKWARENGFFVAERGRIMNHIVEAYEKAHKVV